MYYVYILKSLKDSRLYIGRSSQLKKRLVEHNQGRVTSTTHRRPWKLVYYEGYRNEDDAKDRERGLKKSGSVYMGLIKRIARSLTIEDTFGRP